MTLGRFLQNTQSDMIPPVTNKYLYHFHFNIVAHNAGLEGPDIIVGQLTDRTPITNVELRAMRRTADAEILYLTIMERSAGMSALVPQGVELTAEEKKGDDLIPGLDL
jgi:hypothetical protein